MKTTADTDLSIDTVDLHQTLRVQTAPTNDVERCTYCSVPVDGTVSGCHAWFVGCHAWWHYTFQFVTFGR